LPIRTIHPTAKLCLSIYQYLHRIMAVDICQTIGEENGGNTIPHVKI